MRYLTQAAWCSALLLPIQGIRWNGINDNSARVTISDGTRSISLIFSFGVDGLITSVRTEPAHECQLILRLDRVGIVVTKNEPLYVSRCLAKSNGSCQESRSRLECMHRVCDRGRPK
ncbi:DUF6544 family protein [Undibacterium sp. Xuan67W]|uniref:DUF6544 family protein n=1 Tax=Undibacterium sp. Xuan67W TaxID=3413057 RepID=UPI003BF3D2CA